MEFVILALVVFIIVRNFRNDKSEGRSPVGGGGKGGGDNPKQHLK